MKKVIISVVSIAVVIALVVGGVMIYQNVNGNKVSVEVVPVSNLNESYWMGSNMSSYGNITTDISQNVYLSTNQIVEEMYVSEGDEVSIGDPLFSYDVTLSAIELEIELLSQELLNVKYEAAQTDLTKLKKMTPISASADKIGNNFVMVASADMEDTDTGTQEPVPEDTKTEETPEVTPEETPKETPKETPEETPTETEPETDTDQSETELEEEVLFEELDFKSEPHKGEGTAKDPYVFKCVDKVIIKGEFFNRMKGYDATGLLQLSDEGYYFVIELYDISEEEPQFIVSWLVKPESLSLYEHDKEYVLDSSALMYENPDDEISDMGEWGYDGDGSYSTTEGYTKEELQKLISTKEGEIKNLEFSIRESELKVEKLEKAVSDQTIKSSINGIVTKTGDPLTGADQDGSAFVTVVGSEGFYIKGSLSELDLEKVSVGSMVSGYSYESGTSFEAEITEISDYPGSAYNYYSEGNQNVSYYEFTAFIAESSTLNNNEWAEMTIADSSGGNYSNAIYLYRPYIRTENGQKYVYKKGEDGKLVKQIITTGSTKYDYYEITSGLTEEDMIAFPYGKTVKEGVSVTEVNSFSY